MTDIPVIDAHIHIQPWKLMKPFAVEMMQQGRKNADETSEVMENPRALLKMLDRERIEAVVNINYVSPAMGFPPEINRFAADYAKACDGRVIPFGSVHPDESDDAERDMDELIRLGIRGVKIHPSHQYVLPNAYRSGNKGLETIYRRAEEAGLILMIHTGTSMFPVARNIFADPIYCDEIPIDFPKLKIVLAHGGRPLWMDTAVFITRRHPGVMMDVSSIPPQNLLKYFPRLETLADKVLWGSDWPGPGVPGMRENADRFLELPIPDGAKRKILHDNAAALYGLTR